MNHEIPEIPDTADELIASIDKTKEEEPSPELLDDLKKVARQAVNDYPFDYDPGYHVPMEKGFYRLIDGREAIIAVSPDVDYTEIDLIENIKDQSGKDHRMKKKYMMVMNAISTSINPDIDAPVTEGDYDELFGKAQEEVIDRASYAGPASDEIASLIRLIETSEPVAYNRPAV